MPDTSTIIICGIGTAAVAMAAASLGVGHSLLIADRALDSWPDALVPDRFSRHPVLIGVDVVPQESRIGIAAWQAPPLSKRAARRARGRAKAARRALQGRR